MCKEAFVQMKQNCPYFGCVEGNHVCQGLYLQELKLLREHWQFVKNSTLLAKVEELVSPLEGGCS